MSKNYSIVDAINMIIHEISNKYQSAIYVDHVEAVDVACDWFFFRVRLYENGEDNEPTWLHGLLGLHVNRNNRYFLWDVVEGCDYDFIYNKQEMLAHALTHVTRNKA